MAPRASLFQETWYCCETARRRLSRLEIHSVGTRRFRQRGLPLFNSAQAGGGSPLNRSSARFEFERKRQDRVPVPLPEIIPPLCRRAGGPFSGN